MSNLEVYHKEFRSHSGHDSEENLITLCTLNYAVALDCEPCWTWGASNRSVRCIILQSYSYAVPHNKQI